MSSCTPEAVKLDAWVNPVCRRSNIDTYYVRLSILRALRQALPDLSGTVLDCGCGISPYKPVLLSKPSAVTAYIGLDLKSEIKLASYTQRPDLEWDGTTIPLPAESVGSAIATEVLEHCKDPTHILSELQRVLKPEGAVFLTVPFLWPLHDNPYDEYRYTPFALERHLREAGFERIRIGALGDPHYNGADWNAVRKTYAPLIEGARNPDEMRAILRLMIGELNSSHSGISAPAAGAGGGGGRGVVGQLGLTFDRAAYESAGTLKITEVLPHSPADLAKIQVGEELRAVDGVALGPRVSLDEQLQHKIDKRVVLDISGRQVTVQPVASLAEQIYRKWVEDNRAYVSKISNKDRKSTRLKSS